MNEWEGKALECSKIPTNKCRQNDGMRRMTTWQKIKQWGVDCSKNH